MTKQEEKVIETLTKLKKEFFTAYHLIEAVKRFGLFDGMAYSTKTGRWKYIPRDENGTMNPTYPMCYWNYYPWFVSILNNGIWSCEIISKRSNIYLDFSAETGELVDYIGEVFNLRLTKVNDHYIIEEKTRRKNGDDKRTN